VPRVGAVGGLELVEDAGGVVVRLDGRDQSHVDLDDPRRLVFDYVQRLAEALDAWGVPGEPVRVVHVGGGGLTLPRYVAATRPRSAQVVLEPDTELTEEVRRVLPLPARSGIKVRPVDGRAGVAALRPAYAEVVVVDAFADGRLPASLVGEDFWGDVARVLEPDGWLLLNLSDRAPWQHTRRVLAGVRAHLPHLLLTAEPATLKGRRAGNLVLVASRGEVPTERLRERARRAGLPTRVLDAGAVADAFGGGTAFTDDAEPGPDHRDFAG
jgi:spermidine synthase